MKRFEVDLTICPSDKSISSIETLREVIIAKLADGPYDAFEETNSGVKAYLDADLFDKEFLDNSINDLKECDSEVTCSYEVVELADKNYNEEWEKQHKAVLIDDWCYVRAPFHTKRDDVKYDIKTYTGYEISALKCNESQFIMDNILIIFALFVFMIF